MMSELYFEFKHPLGHEIPHISIDLSKISFHCFWINCIYQLCGIIETQMTLHLMSLILNLSGASNYISGYVGGVLSWLQA